MDNIMELISSVVSIVLGISLLASSYYGKKDNKSLSQNGLTTKGDIIEVKTEYDDDGNESYYATVRFKTIDGFDIINPYPIPFENRVKVGQTVSILYDTSDHHNFVVNNNFENEYTFYAKIGIGISFFIIGCYKYYIYLKS